MSLPRARVAGGATGDTRGLGRAGGPGPGPGPTSGRGPRARPDGARPGGAPAPSGCPGSVAGLRPGRSEEGRGPAERRGGRGRGGLRAGQGPAVSAREHRCDAALTVRPVQQTSCRVSAACGFHGVLVARPSWNVRQMSSWRACNGSPARAQRPQVEPLHILCAASFSTSSAAEKRAWCTTPMFRNRFLK